MKLSPTQLSAYLKLSPMVWKCAYELNVSMATLDALVKKGWAEKTGVGSLGSSYSPRTTIHYRACRPTQDTPDLAKAAPVKWSEYRNGVAWATKSDDDPPSG